MQAIIDRTENMKIRLEKLSYHGENIEELSDDIFRLECVHVDMLALAVAVGEIYRGSSDVVFYMGDAHTVHLASFLESVGLVKTDHRRSCYAESSSLPCLDGDEIPTSNDVIKRNASRLTSTIVQVVPAAMLSQHAICRLSNFLPINIIAHFLKP
jgi:hypothetical protein